MEDVRIILSASWVALMLTYLLGDVLRICSGDFKAEEIAGTKNDSESVAGSCCPNGDSDRYGFPVSDVELSCDSLGKHHHGNSLFWFQSYWIALIPFRLRQILDNCRTSL